MSLPLGVWLLAPFLAGLVSAGVIAIILPRRHRSQRQPAPARSGPSRTTVNEPRGNPETSPPVADPNWVDEGLEDRPGKTRVPRESGRPERPNSASEEPLTRSQTGEPEQEVWDEEDWPEEDQWPEEEKSAEVMVGDYEVPKKPISAYREGTLYSYSYSQSALTEKSEADMVDSPDSEELELAPKPQVSETPEEAQQSEERLDEEETIPEASEVLPLSEQEPEAEETIEGEFLDDSDESEDAQPSQSFFGSKLFNLRRKSSETDDWTEPSNPPKDW
ncbi:MAG: hypothetical protein JJU32_03105 [Phormidium sp. BM_Day4_Bin.17]|nr:hypothetical protein [Phormidium sp. BM_Day4_Bin.17]UCJ12970.1 MAG: hypothetical protein JWS08_04005 [Phormidium sp. PBR-2020]